MVKTIIEQASDLLGKEGMKIGPSDWMDVSQKRIDTFADATGDHQWIHVDEEKAKAWIENGAAFKLITNGAKKVKNELGSIGIITDKAW